MDSLPNVFQVEQSNWPTLEEMQAAELEHAAETIVGLLHFHLEQAFARIQEDFADMARAIEETLPKHHWTPWAIQHLKTWQEHAGGTMNCLRSVLDLPPVVTPDEADAIVDPICNPARHQVVQSDDALVPIDFEYGPHSE